MATSRKNKYIRIEQTNNTDKCVTFTIQPDDERNIHDISRKKIDGYKSASFFKSTIGILNLGTLYGLLRNVLQTLLLPIGYPDSVCPEYIMFQLWDTSQEACGYFRGILNNQAWLINLGVGNPDATIVSSVLLTMILDYANMVSGLVIAGSPSTIRMFVSNQKFWVLVKEYMNFSSTILTLLSLSYQQHMLKILIVAKVIDAAASVIDGACHSTLVTHIARRNNFSDCNAKEKNQSRTLKLVLIALGYPFLIFVNERGHRVFWAFIVLSLLKIFCQYKAMGTLMLRTLSPNRLQNCINAWCKKEHDKMSIPYIAANESVVYPQVSDISNVWSSMDDLSCSAEEFKSFTTLHDQVQHILIANHSHNDCVLLKEGASDHDIVTAYIHYFVYRYHSQMDDAVVIGNEMELVRKSLDVTVIEFPNIVRSLEAHGWDVSNMSLLAASEYRVKVQYSIDGDFDVGDKKEK